MPTAEDRLRAALAYVDPKIADADERYYTALHKAGVLKAPWSVTKAHGGIRGLPDAQRQLVIRLASGKVGSFTPTLAEKVGAVPLQAGAKVLSMGLEGLADINKPILELDPLQKSWQWVKAQLEALPRALVVRAVSARQGKPMGQIAHEWQVLKNTVAHFSENPELDQLLRQKGVSYKDALLQGGADPRIAAYGGFLLDALMPDKVTSAAGVIGRSAMAVKGARRQAALRQVEALETARRAERLADRTAREGKVLEQIGAEGVRALPEKAPARRLSEAVAQTAKADRAAAQLARVQAKGFPTVEAFKAAQAEKWAKAAAEKARLQAQLQARAEIEFAQSLAGQRKAMQAGAKALQQKELDQYLESQPRREFPGQPKVQVPGGRAELPPVSSPRPQPAAELEAMPQYIQQLGGPKEIDRKLAAFRQAEAERGAKAAADKEAAKAAKGTKAPRAPKRPAEPKPKLAPTIPYKQTDIDKTLDSYRRVGVPENYLKQVEDQLYAGTGQAFIDQARKWRAQWAKEAGQAKKQARLQEESLERPIDEAAALADPFDAERLDSLAQAPARAPAEPARPKSEPLAQSSPRFTATDAKETPEVMRLRRQQDDLETALWRLTKVPLLKRKAGGIVAKTPQEQALMDKLAAVNQALAEALRPKPAPAPPTKTEEVTRMIREGVPERGPGWETESLEVGLQGEGRSARPLEGLPGQKAIVYTPASNQPVETQYRVVSLDDVIPSQADDFTDNPRYRADLQPRDRSRIASRQQVEQMGKTLTPERLGEAGTTAEGAPIVGPDRMVESGNGRVLALRQARATNSGGWAQYQAWLTQNAARFGIDPQGLAGVKDAVLVRVREGDLAPEARAALAEEMGRSAVLAMSATEAAAADAARLFRGELLDLLHPETGLFAHANRGFVEKFFGEIPMGERAALMNPRGGLSLAGQERVQNALLAAAYGDSALLPKLIENPDDDIKSIGYALQEAAPTMARLKREIVAGRVVPQADITAPLTQAIQTIAHYRSPAMRDRGLKLADFLQQTPMFDDPAMPLVKELAGFMGQSRVSKDKLKAFLKSYANSALMSGQAQQTAIGGQRFDSVASVQAAAKSATQRGQSLLWDESGKVLLPKEAQAQVQRIGEALGTLKGKDFDALLAKITRLQRIGKLYASPQGAWRDILGTALTHAAIFESDPLAWMSAAIDLKLDDLAKSKRGWALDTFLDSAADVWPVAGPQGLMRGLESGGKADAAAIPLPKPLDRGRALRQGVNRFWEKMGLVEALKRMALTGTPQDVALAQKLLKGDELPLSHAVRPITRPVRLADFSPEAQKALHWGVTATSGDPFQPPAWLKTLSNRGIGPLFHTWAVQVPMHRGQALLKAASEWNPGPAWQTYKEGRAYANFAGPPAVNEEGQPVRGPLYPPPPGKTQYQQKGMDFMIDPFRYGVAYDLKGSPTARMSVAGIAGEGPQQAAGNLPGPYLEKAKHLIGGSLSGLSALVQPGIWPQLLYRGTQILKGDENPVQPGVDAGLIAPEAAAKLSASLRSAGVANPNTPGAKAGRLLLELGKQFAPSEVTQALKLPQLAPTLGLGRKSPSGLPSQEGMDYLIYLLGGASKPASRYDLSIGPYLQMLENRRGLKGANR